MHKEDPDLHPAGNGNLSKVVRNDSVALYFTKTSLGAAPSSLEVSSKTGGREAIGLLCVAGQVGQRGSKMRADKSSEEPRTGPRSVGRGLRVRGGKSTSRLDQKSQ